MFGPRASRLRCLFAEFVENVSLFWGTREADTVSFREAAFAW